MAFRTQKISQMTPKGADLEATDLIEVSTIESGSYVTRSITGQELIDAIPLPPTGLTIGTTPIASGTIGRVLFQGTGNVLQQSPSLFWDGTNNRLGIGTSSPTFRLEVQGGDVRFANGLTIGTAGSAGWQFSSNTVTLIQNGFVSVDFANGREFSFTNASFSTTYLKLASVTGNVLINTTTDAGFRLDVNGTARVQGDTTITKTGSALNVQFISQNAQNNFLNVLNGTDGLSFTSRGSGTTGNMGLPANSAEILSFNKAALGLILHTTAYLAIGTHTNERMRLVGSTGNLLINTTTDAGFRLDVNGTARVSGQLTVGSSGALGNISTGSAQGLNLIVPYLVDFTFGATRTHRLAINQFGLNSFIGNNIAIGYDPSGASPASAKIELGAGTATAGTAPLKLRAGTNLTTPENGAFEYDGTNLYFTVGGVRKTVTLV